MSRGAGSELELSEAARLAENDNPMTIAAKPESVDLPARRRRGMSRFATAGNVPLTLVVLLLLWEISVRVAEVPMYLVPPPSAVIYRMVTDWKLLLDQTRVTTFEVVI